MSEGAADYIRRVTYVVKIRDRPSERCWDKLYEFLDEEEGEERDSEELAEALYEANSYKSIYGLRLS